MSKKKKKLVIAATVLFLLAIVVIVFLNLRENWVALSTKFTESKDSGIVEYQGKKYRYNNDLSNYLFLGIDTRDPIESFEVRGEAGQADTIYLASYNRQEKTTKFLAIPRDTMAEIQVFAPDGTDLGTNIDQITLQYGFGSGKRNSCELMKKAVSKVLHGVPIRGYCAINMDGIPLATEAVGGFELTVPDDALATVNPDFVKGKVVTITKETAEQFVRYRDTEEGQSAISRMERQKSFIEAFGKKTKSLMQDDVQIIATIYENVEDYMVTSMDVALLVEIAEATNMSDIEIKNIPGKGVDGDEFDEYYINEEQLYELIIQMFYEEI